MAKIRPSKVGIAVVVIASAGAALAVILFKKGGNMAKNISNKCLNLIKQFEGLRLKAYQCQAGVWTIGYGHTEGVTEGQTITQEQADELLAKDVATFERGVLKALPNVKLTQGQLDALTSFSYNVGLRAFRGSTLREKVAANPQDPSIATEFKKWVYVGKTVSKGLTRRRNKEAELYFS